jgi:hypothetical protein
MVCRRSSATASRKLSNITDLRQWLLTVIAPTSLAYVDVLNDQPSSLVEKRSMVTYDFSLLRASVERLSLLHFD